MNRLHFFPLLVAGLLAVAVPRLPAAEKPQLTVSAAASLKDALNEINRGYGAATVTVNYGASGALQQQISQGAPVDAFISAAAKNMDALVAEGLVEPGSRADIAANRLVLVVPTKADKTVTSFRDLAKPSVTHVAMGSPDSVPAGKYAVQVLKKLNLAAAVSRKAVYGKDVRAVLTQVELGNVDAGIVYRTDALTSKKVRIVSTAPVSLHSPIRYPAAAIAGRPSVVAAKGYVRYLSGPQAQKILRRYGFITP